MRERTILTATNAFRLHHRGQAILLFDGKTHSRAKVTNVISDSQIETKPVGWLWWKWSAVRYVIGHPSWVLRKLQGVVDRVRDRFSAS